MSHWRQLVAGTWRICRSLYAQMVGKIRAATTPRQRLKRTVKSLRKQLSAANSSGMSTVPTGNNSAADRAWQTYHRALSFALACDHPTLAKLILDFDSQFDAQTKTTGLVSGQAIAALLEAAPQTSQNIEAAWLLSKRIDDPTAAQDVQQRISLQTASLGESNLLFAQLLHRRTQSAITPAQLHDIISRFLSAYTFELTNAWRAFFEQLDDDKLPQIHQVYALMGRDTKAAELAEVQGDYRSAAEYLEPLAGSEAALWRLSLRQQVGEEDAIAQAHQTVSDIFWQAADYPKALEHAQAADNRDRISACHQKLGNLSAAIQARPDISPEWIQEIRTATEAASRANLDKQDFLTTVRQLKSIQTAWQEKKQESEVEWTKYLLLGTIRTARTAFASELETCQGQQRNDLLKRWSQLEESAGNYQEAALKAEAAGDFFGASVLFEKADAFGQAIAVLETSPTDTITPARRAQLAESGGDFFAAAQQYEQLGEADKAIELYARAGEFGRAAELRQQQIGAEEAVFDRRLQELLSQAGRLEQLAERCAARARESGIEADEKARLWRRVRALAEEGVIKQQWLEVVIAELPAIEKSGRLRFAQQASGWIATATQEVLADYTDAIGLDLGTSNSVVCLYNRQKGELEVVKKHRQGQIPSVFAIDQSGKELIGLPIPELLAKSPRAIVTKAKRVMGTAKKYRIGGKNYRPEEISARLINYARDLARAYLLQKVAERVGAIATEVTGARPPADWIDAQLKQHPPALPLSRSVITVPAYFNEAQKQATKDAATMAGAQLLRLVHEPTAACLAQRIRTSQTETILVADLGAGTFDLSVIEVGEGVFEVKEIEGNNTLGSADIDELLYTHFNALVSAQTGHELPFNSQAATRLRHACEELKIELTAQREWQINLPFLTDKQDFQLSLTRTALEEMIAPWLYRIKTTCQRIRNKQPDRILLIGGGGKMPAVRQCLQEIYHLEPQSAHDPTTVVARGAALQAAILLGDVQEALLIDVAPFSLGIRCRTATGNEEFSPVIAKHTPIPTDRTQCYSTADDNQSTVRIEVFQGESHVPEENFKVGQFMLQGIPPAKAGVPKIDVTFSIDKDCLLTVTARNQGTNNEKRIVIADSHLLTPAQMSSVKSEFQRSLIYQKSLEQLQDLNNIFKSIIESAQRLDIYSLMTRLQESIQRYEQNRERFAPTESDNAVLTELYRDRTSAYDKTQLALDQWGSLNRSIGQWLTECGEINWHAKNIETEVTQLITAGIALAQRGQTTQDNIVELYTRFQKWLGTLNNLPVNIEGDAEAIARHFLTLQRYTEALDHIQQLTPPLTTAQATLTLEILARNRKRDTYMTLLAKQALALNLHTPNLSELNQSIRIYARSVVLIQVSFQDGPSALNPITLGNPGSSGSGFAISPTQIATNRHVITNPTTRRSVNPSSLQIITQQGPRSVATIHQPSWGNDDVAILTLEPEPNAEPLLPLRLGFSELVEVGEQIISVGFPDPENASFADNLYCNTGLINCTRALPEICSERSLEISTPLRGGISGAPILNKLGEVIGLSTFWRERQQPAAGGRVLSEKSFYAIPVGVLRRLKSEIS